MILIYLFLGHFIADYPLQPNKLVAWKNRSWKGVSVHVSIHFLVTSLLLYIYLPTVAVILISLPVALIHFLIDSIKAAHERKHRHSALAYWVDQGFHFLSLIAVYLLGAKFVLAQTRPVIFTGVTSPFLSLYANPALLIFLSLSIFITLAIEYSRYKDRHKTTKNLAPLNKKAMIKRLFFLSLIYIGLLFMFPAYITALMSS
jgi:type IV secretory pathway VirB3-like protein